MECEIGCGSPTNIIARKPVRKTMFGKRFPAMMTINYRTEKCGSVCWLPSIKTCLRIKAWNGDTSAWYIKHIIRIRLILLYLYVFLISEIHSPPL